jgi:hypothetical protein
MQSSMAMKEADYYEQEDQAQDASADFEKEERKIIKTAEMRSLFYFQPIPNATKLIIISSIF